MKKPRFVWRAARGYYWTFNVYRRAFLMRSLLERVEAGPYPTMSEAWRVYRDARRAVDGL